MRVPPTACNNRVDAKITSMKINSEGRTIDVISKHGSTLSMQALIKDIRVKISLQRLMQRVRHLKRRLLGYYYSIWI